MLSALVASDKLYFGGSHSKGAYRMIKSELVQRVAAQNLHLYQRDIEKVIDTMLDQITITLARGDRVELRGFGVFCVRHRHARLGRNPRTGAQVAIDRRNVPFFKTGEEMRERLNQPGHEQGPAQLPARSDLLARRDRGTADEIDVVLDRDGMADVARGSGHGRFRRKLPPLRTCFDGSF
jgi:integration host factor subunit beta